MNDLDKAKKLMAERDWQGGIAKPLADCMDTYLGLADEVPGLVHEVEQLRTEVKLLRGPFTCKHAPVEAGAACGVCHAEWVERALKAESLARRTLKMLRSYDSDFPEKWLVKAKAFVEEIDSQSTE